MTLSCMVYLDGVEFHKDMFNSSIKYFEWFALSEVIPHVYRTNTTILDTNQQTVVLKLIRTSILFTQYKCVPVSLVITLFYLTGSTEWNFNNNRSLTFETS